jgi:hypothetical protein
MTTSRPTPSQRQLLQRLRTDRWRRLASVSVRVGETTFAGLVANGWIGQRGKGQDYQVRLTATGLKALRARLPVAERRREEPWPDQARPTHTDRVPLPKPQVRPKEIPFPTAIPQTKSALRLSRLISRSIAMNE